MIRRILVGLLGLVVLAIVGLAGFLFVSPPLLLRVADGYAAKIICSNVFLANRDANAVLADDVQAPGNPILKTILANVDTANGVVTTRILGLFATGTAVYRPGLGCADVPDGDVAKAKAVAIDAPTITPLPADAIWPAGEAVGAANDKVQALLGDAGLTGPGMRAVVVVKDGMTLDESTVIAHCRERLAHFKCPKRVIFADSLPRNPSGKILKRNLRKAYETPA